MRFKSAQSLSLSAMLATLALSSSTPAWAAETWNSYYAKGQDALANQSLPTAEDNFRKANELIQSAGKVKPEDLEKCMMSLADTLSLRNKTAEATVIYTRLLNRLTSRLGAKNPKIVPVLMALGSIQEAEGDHPRAMTYYQQALNINESHYGPYSPALADNLATMGRCSFKAGNSADGHKHYKRAIGILTQDPALSASAQLRELLKGYKDIVKGDDTSNKDLIEDFNKDINPGKSANSSSSSGTSSSGQGQSDFQKQSAFKLNAQTQAESDMDPQIVLRGVANPTSDASLAPVFKTMNETIFKQTHLIKGEEYYERKIAIDIKALGAEHPSVANDMTGLAVLYLARQNYGPAKDLLQRSLPIYKSNYGEGNILTINTQVSLATAEFHLGNTDRAAELYRNALSHGQSSLGPNSLETARILNDLGYLYFTQGKLQESCTFYEWALASTESAVGQKDPLLAACLKDYAKVLRGLGRNSEALAIETRATAISPN